MDKKMPKKLALLAIPGFLLFIIFWSLDWDRLVMVIKTTRPVFMGVGVIIYPSIIVSGALRWYALLSRWFPGQATVGFAMRHYWIGLAIGRFFPAGLTWDLYRVVMAGRKFGGYTRHTIIVLIEKLAALLAASFLVGTLWFMVRPWIIDDTPITNLLSPVRDGFRGILQMPSWVLILILALATGLMAAVSAKWLAGKKINFLADLIAPVLKDRLYVPLTACSLGVYLAMAVANIFFFLSLNTHVPLTVHLFLMPVFAVLSMLPVSFGGLGVREGSFILGYGLFGIAMETALVAAFMNLVASLINCLIGGMVMAASPGGPDGK